MKTELVSRTAFEPLPGFAKPIEMEYVARCLLCGSSDLRPLFKAARVHPSRHTGPKFMVCRCRGCGLVLTNPRPTSAAIGTFYESYFDGYMSTPSDIYARRARDVAAIFGRAGRILDVGCGTGTFLAEMEQLGWVGAGIEPDPVAVEFARREYRLAIDRGTLDDAPRGEPFDVVTLWHTLEHVHDPVSALEKAFQRLKPGGFLVVEVPNFGSLQARVFRSAWYALMVPEHLWHFTEATLKRMLSECGFDEIRIEPSFDRAGWGTSARLAFSDVKRRFLPRTAPPVVTGASTPTQADVQAQESVVDRIQELLNRAGHSVESRILRDRFGTLAMRAICRRTNA